MQWIYGSKLPESEGAAPRTMAVYVAINPYSNGAIAIICTMVTVKIKGTACGLYNIVPLSDHSLHKLQAIYSQLGRYVSSGSYSYHGWETIVQAS